jgi:hypothetical protein
MARLFLACLDIHWANYDSHLLDHTVLGQFVSSCHWCRSLTVVCACGMATKPPLQAAVQLLPSGMFLQDCGQPRLLIGFPVDGRLAHAAAEKACV